MSIQDALRSGIQRYGRVLRTPEPRLLIGASSLSDIGDWMNIVAVSVLAYRLGGDLLAVGGLLALRKLPGVLLQIPAGAWVDRAQGYRLLIGSQIVMAFLAASLILLSFYPSLWLLYALMTAFETANVVTFPAFRSAVARMVPADDRGAATALLSLEDTLSSAVGPIIGGLILAASSANWVFLINGLTYLVIAVAVANVGRRGHRLSDVPQTSAEASVEPSSGGLGVPTGYRMLLQRPDVLGFSMMTVIGTLIFQGAIAIFIVRAIDLGLGEEGLGVFYAALAAGAFIGGLVAGLGTYATRSILIFIGVMELTNAIGFGLFATLSVPAVVIAILVLIGITSELAETPALTYFQNTLPEEVFGRFFSIFLTAIRLGGLIGVLFVPWIGIRTGYSNALLMLVVAGAAIATTYIIFARRWQQPIPPEALAPGSMEPMSGGAV